MDEMKSVEPMSRDMTRKPLSWLGTAIMFLFMVAGYLGSSALFSPFRHQMNSIHSIFWTFAAPWSIACLALLALAVQLIPSLLTRLRRSSPER
jgi:hypothetical protein